MDDFLPESPPTSPGLGQQEIPSNPPSSNAPSPSNPTQTETQKPNDPSPPSSPSSPPALGGPRPASSEPQLPDTSTEPPSETLEETQRRLGFAPLTNDSQQEGEEVFGESFTLANLANPNNISVDGSEPPKPHPLPETLTDNHFPTPPRDGTGYGRSPSSAQTPQNTAPAFAVRSWSGAKNFDFARDAEDEEEDENEHDPIPYPFNYDEVEDGEDEEEEDEADQNQFVMPTFNKGGAYRGDYDAAEAVDEDEEDEDEYDDEDDYDDDADEDGAFGLLNGGGYEAGFEEQGIPQVTTNNGHSIIMGVKPKPAAAKKEIPAQNPTAKVVKKKKKVVKKRQAPANDDSEDDDMEGLGPAPVDNTINDRHRAWLQNIAEQKRAQRENEEQAKVDQEQRRLKKKQALVKKAIMRRKQQEQEVGFSATTKLSKKNKLTREVKAEISQEEQAALDKQKYDRVVQLRKEHKDRYKKQVAEIKAKVQAEKEAKELKEKKEELRKKRIKENALKKITQEKILIRTTGVAGAAMSPPRVKQLSSQDDGAGTASAKKLKVSDKQESPDFGVGSAVTAVRKRTKSMQVKATTSSKLPIGVVEAEPVDPEEQAKKKEENAARNARIKEKQMQELAKLKEKNEKKKMEEELKKKQLHRREKLLKAKWEKKADDRASEEVDGGDAEEENETTAETTRKPKAKPSANTKPPLSRPAKAIEKAKEVASTVQEDDVQIKGPDGKVVKVLSAEEASTLGSRLSQHKKGSGKVVGPRDYADWKKKNGVKKDQQVFSMTGWYPCVKEDLIERGWFFNEDRDSPYFDLKWTLRSSDSKINMFQPWQLTNHFLKNTAITTKVGLLKSLRSLSWFASVSEDAIFPRGYDLSQYNELAEFLDDYRCVRAESLLKLVLIQAGRFGLDIEGVDVGNVDVPKGEDLDKGTLGSSKLEVNERMFKMLLNVVRKRGYGLEDAFIDDAKRPHASMVSDVESELIAKGDAWLWKAVDSSEFDVDTIPEPVDAFLKEEDKKEYQLLNTGIIPGRKKDDGPTASQIRAYENRKLRKLLENRKVIAEDLAKVRQITQSDVKEIVEALQSLQAVTDPLQKTLDGVVSNNLWIVKPAGKSRGRGIATFKDLPKILDYVDAKTRGNGEQWVVQKYMENPLTIAKRKFDVRQWVLVTDWNPLTIWFYDDCYCRFAAAEYDDPQKSLDKLEGSLKACLEGGGNDNVKDKWLENQYVHLVNNSITKNNDKFHDGYVAENGVKVEDNMWPASTFSDWIHSETGEDLWSTKILPRMKEIAKYSIMCAQDMVEHRKNSWELYGIDFMFDKEYEPWLIEINSSPACDYSTAVTESYVQRALPDILKVVLDFKGWEKKRAEGKAKKADEPETGGWEMIHKGEEIPTPLSAFGSDFGVTGSKIKIERGAAAGGGAKAVRAVKESRLDEDEDDVSDDAESEEEEEEEEGEEESEDEEEEEEKEAKPKAPKVKKEKKEKKEKKKVAAKVSPPPPDLEFDDSDLSDFEEEKEKSEKEKENLDDAKATEKASVTEKLEDKESGKEEAILEQQGEGAVKVEESQVKAVEVGRASGEMDGAEKENAVGMHEARTGQVGKPQAAQERRATGLKVSNLTFDADAVFGNMK
ncbi:hypothetical protein TrVE_jg7440 [Triparma verrucosa]|uniref:Uncharacterized protein n=1 Tax=Triparma verrucosa TaxID=1606542 RepID=A0A9W7FKS6_9STRA|nr:hypothetical protein TrVE_jg7440 [Triparma verrucosa]